MPEMPILPARSEVAAPAALMRAAVVCAPRQIEIRHVPVPDIGKGQVLVRLEGCGVCASNLPPWEGRPWFTYPMAPGALGHEGWGRVEALGAEVEESWRGKRVAVLSQHAYAEYDVALLSAVVPLAPGLEKEPFPGEPLGCAMNIFARSGIGKGDTVAVIGIGFLGAILTELCAGAGARVFAIGRRPSALELARQRGAAEALGMENGDGPIIEKIAELTGGRFCDVVIEAVGKQRALDLAGELTRERGRLVVAGYHQDGLRQVNMQLWNWRGLDVINAHERDPAVAMRGLAEAIDAVASGRLDPTPLYTHSYPLERLDEALNATRDRPDGFLKALVTF